MRVGICNDHRGFALKQKVLKYLNKNGYTIIDYGTDSNDPVDYPDFAFKMCKGLINNEITLGIALCGTGIGISIACNKVKGIRCAKVDNEVEARLSKLHNDANVIAFSARLSCFKMKKIIKAFLETEFNNEQRHIIRINKIKNYEGVTINE